MEGLIVLGVILDLEEDVEMCALGWADRIVVVCAVLGRVDGHSPGAIDGFAVGKVDIISGIFFGVSH